MLTKFRIGILTAALVSLLPLIFAPVVSAQAQQGAADKGLTAIESASKANRHLYVFFYSQDNDRAKELRSIFDSSVSGIRDQADSISIAVTDPSETGIVTKFGVKDAPMPLVVVLAPNGAVTGSFPSNFTKEQLLEALATPAMEQLLGSLQHGKLVLLCVQNGKTRGSEESMSGVKAFKADERYATATDIVMLDPSLPAEKPFLTKLGMNGPIDEATTLFVAPPGSVIGSFKGATDKNQLITALTNAVKACGPGCKPGQCGVGK